MGQASTRAQGKSTRFLRPLLEGACDQCRGPLNGSGRGKPQRFCGPECKWAFQIEARRVGEAVLRRRRQAAMMPPRAKPLTTSGALNFAAMTVPQRQRALAEAAMAAGVFQREGEAIWTRPST